MNDEYLDYVDSLRRYHNNLNLEVSPSKWAELYPELQMDVSILLLDKYEKAEKLKKQIKKDLSEPLDEDIKLWRTAFIETTVAKEVAELEQQISWLKRFLITFTPDSPTLTEKDLNLARSVPVSAIFSSLKQRGAILLGCCPFHEEKTPSFTVFKDNHFHCFGCGEHGDVIDFVMKLNKLNFVEAVKYLLKLQ